MSRFRSVVGALSALLVLAATLTVMTPRAGAAPDDEEPPGPWLMFRSVDIAGDFVAGETLHGSFRTWNGDFASVELHWVRCDRYPYDPDGVEGRCDGFEGGTGDTHVLGADDVGTYIALYAVGFNEEGQAISAQYGQPGIVVEPLLGTPSLPSGSLYSGDEISVTLNDYIPVPAGATYEWMACPTSGTYSPEDGCVVLADREGQMITATDDLVGSFLVAEVTTGTPGNYSTQYTGSSGVVRYTYGDLAPEIAPADGTHPVAGDTITLTPTDDFAAYFALRGASSDVVTVRVLGCDIDDNCDYLSASATAPGGPWTVALPEDWAGRTLTTRMTVTGDGEAWEGANRMRPTAVVVAARPAAPSIDVAPVLSGLVVDGETLSVTTGSWDGDTPMTYAYEWSRCDEGTCVAVPGATASTYRLTSADVGHDVVAKVTATNEVGSASYWTDWSGLVEFRPLSGPDPVVSGSPVVGSTLSATVGDWDGSGPIGSTWTWERCAAPTSCVAIDGATTETYRPVLADLGSQLRARLTVASAWDDAEVASDLSAVVAPAAPGAAVDTGSVHPGGSITVSGSDFGPRTTVTVTLHSDPVLLGTVVTDALGAFTATFQIPAGVPAGAHHVVLEGVDAAGNPRTVSMPLTIAATAEPGSAAPSTTGASPTRTPAALALTGSTVAGLVVSAVALLLAGAWLTSAGRRRATVVVESGATRRRRRTDAG